LLSHNGGFNWEKAWDNRGTVGSVKSGRGIPIIEKAFELQEERVVISEMRGGELGLSLSH